MKCWTVKIPGGPTAIVCGSKPRTKPCYKQSDGCSGRGEFLCDYPVAEGKTCDRPCCRAHAKRIGEDRDHCVEHALLDARLQAEKQRGAL